MYKEKTVAVYLCTEAYEMLKDFHFAVLKGFGALGYKGVIKGTGQQSYGVTVVLLYVDALPYLQRCLQASSGMLDVWHRIELQIKKAGAEEEFFRMEAAFDTANNTCAEHLLQGEALRLTWEGRTIKATCEVKNEYTREPAESKQPITKETKNDKTCYRCRFTRGAGLGGCAHGCND